jgi:D-sedoheptulose 7-phosphate isomerase
VVDGYRQRIVQELDISRDVLTASLADEGLITAVEQAATHVVEAFRAGRKLLIAGNGGSAADAQHIAGEFISRFNFDRAPLPAIALTTDSSILTAIGNDYGYQHTFERQVRGLGVVGDIFLGISTSGRSPNIVAALEAARAAGLTTIGLTGSRHGPMSELCDVIMQVPDGRTPMIQQIHITLAHIICAIAEEAIFGAGRG